MKIGIDIRHLTSQHISGVGYYTVNLIKHLALEAPEDEFILFSSGSKPRLYLHHLFPQENVTIIHKQIPNKLLSLLLSLPGGPTLESFLPVKLDLWLFPNLNIIRTSLPYVITAHDVSFKLYPTFFTLKQRLWHAITKPKLCFSHARKVLAVSQSTKRDLHHFYNIPLTQIHTTPLAADKLYSPKIKPSDKNFLRSNGINASYFLTLSTLEPRKNLSSVVEAYESWRSKTHQPHPPKLVIAGGSGWKTSELSAHLIASPVRQDIILAGYIPDKHKPALFRNAKALFFPSYYEGFGLPPVEAMACGTPVVTSFTGSLPEAVKQAAIMIDPYNIQDLEQTFEALEDPLLLEELSRRGIKQSHTFSWQKTAKETLNILRLEAK